MALSAIPPTNCWTKVERKVADTLLACASLLPFLGVADSSEAAAGNMWFDAIEEADEEWTASEWSEFFPQVIIGTPGDDAAGFEMDNDASGPSFLKSGTVEVIFAAQLTQPFANSWMREWLNAKFPGQFLDPYTPTISDEERIFKNAVGDIIEEMGTKEILSTISIAVQEYGRNDENERYDVGLVQSCVVHVTWGSKGGGDA